MSDSNLNQLNSGHPEDEAERILRMTAVLAALNESQIRILDEMNFEKVIETAMEAEAAVKNFINSTDYESVDVALQLEQIIYALNEINSAIATINPKFSDAFANTEAELSAKREGIKVKIDIANESIESFKELYSSLVNPSNLSGRYKQVEGTNEMIFSAEKDILNSISDKQTKLEKELKDLQKEFEIENSRVIRELFSKAADNSNVLKQLLDQYKFLVLERSRFENHKAKLLEELSRMCRELGVDIHSQTFENSLGKLSKNYRFGYPGVELVNKTKEKEQKPASLSQEGTSNKIGVKIAESKDVKTTEKENLPKVAITREQVNEIKKQAVKDFFALNASKASLRKQDNKLDFARKQYVDISYALTKAEQELKHMSENVPKVAKKGLAKLFRSKKRMQVDMHAAEGKVKTLQAELAGAKESFSVVLSGLTNATHAKNDSVENYILHLVEYHRKAKEYGSFGVAITDRIYNETLDKAGVPESTKKAIMQKVDKIRQSS